MYSALATGPLLDGKTRCCLKIFAKSKVCCVRFLIYPYFSNGMGSEIKIAGFDVGKLTDFLWRAKQATWVNNSGKTSPRAAGAEDYCFYDGDFVYRDSYFGFFQFGGREVVHFKGDPVWGMNYFGCMPEISEEIKTEERKTVFAKKTFEFLKEALRQMPRDLPLRGPAGSPIVKDSFSYHNEVRSSSETPIERFEGREMIYFGEGDGFTDDIYPPYKVFELVYHGGLIVSKPSAELG